MGFCYVVAQKLGTRCVALPSVLSPPMLISSAQGKLCLVPLSARLLQCVATCVFVSLAALSRFSLVNRGSFGRVRTADLYPSRHQKGVTVQQLGYAASRRQYEFTFLAIYE